MSFRPRRWRLRLRHIIEAVEKIQNYVGGMSIGEFLADSRTSDAVLRNLEIIGEAARLVPEEVISRHEQVPWADMRAVRNIVAHEYDRVNLHTIWETVQHDLPPLVPLLRQVLEREGEDWPDLTKEIAIVPVRTACDYFGRLSFPRFPGVEPFLAPRTVIIATTPTPASPRWRRPGRPTRPAGLGL